MIIETVVVLALFIFLTFKGASRLRHLWQLFRLMGESKFNVPMPISRLGALDVASVIALMALVSLAVVVHFRRKPDRTETQMRVLVLPVVAGLALLTILVLAIANFDVLTGASECLAWGLTALLPLAGIVGAVLATRLRRSEPEKYAHLGSNRL